MAAAWPILPLRILQPMRRQGLTPRQPLTLKNTTTIQRVRMGAMVLNRAEAHITIPIEIHTDAPVALGPELLTILRSTWRCNMWGDMTLSAVLPLQVVAPHLLDLTPRMVAGRPRGLKLHMVADGVVHRGQRQRMERAGAGRRVLKLPMVVDGMVHRGPRQRTQQAGAGRRVLKLPMVVRTQLRPARTTQMATTDDDERTMTPKVTFPFPWRP